jgi:hypothetical protein
VIATGPQAFNRLTDIAKDSFYDVRLTVFLVNSLTFQTESHPILSIKLEVHQMYQRSK